MAFLVLTVTVGAFYNSSMLVGDALRKFINLSAKLAQMRGEYISRRATAPTYSYGFLRATVVASFFSSTLFIGMASYLAPNALLKCVALQYMIAPRIVLMINITSLALAVVKHLLSPRAHSPIRCRRDDRTASISASSMPPSEHDHHTCPRSVANRPGRTRRTTAPSPSPLLEPRTIHPSSFRQDIIHHPQIASGEPQGIDIDTDTDAAPEPSPPLSPIHHHHRPHHRPRTPPSPERNLWDASDLLWTLTLTTASLAIHHRPHTPLEYLDPLLALLLCALPVLRASARLLLDAAPPHIDPRYPSARSHGRTRRRRRPPKPACLGPARVPGRRDADREAGRRPSAGYTDRQVLGRDGEGHAACPT
ncbi:hypothetical protein F5Y15DRAFT_425837 [Xylariaceae sp. FL0016]|nr:hypothetical protein F5Y15DRAFT_425837 [Xylariaceae sp. FL0016]